MFRKRSPLSLLFFGGVNPPGRRKTDLVPGRLGWATKTILVSNPGLIIIVSRDGIVIPKQHSIKCPSRVLQGFKILGSDDLFDERIDNRVFDAPRITAPDIRRLGTEIVSKLATRRREKIVSRNIT